MIWLGVKFDSSLKGRLLEGGGEQPLKLLKMQIFTNMDDIGAYFAQIEVAKLDSHQN